jgi:hypothetical protein
VQRKCGFVDRSQVPAAIHSARVSGPETVLA